MATLVCEYYAEVGIREKLVAVGKAASAGSAEQALLGSTFEPATLMRLPRTNRPGGQFPALAMFTFPHGARLVTHEEAMANAIPVVTSFVLTAEDKSRMYGACIVWYEELPAAVALTFLEQLELVPADGASLPTLHAPEAICLLSRMPVFEGLMECCRQLFRMRLQAAGAIPEELLEPLLGARLPGFNSACSIPLGNVTVPFSMPAANLLPHTMAGRDFLLLLQSLDVGNLLMLWGLVLTEAKVVLQARQPHVLTMAAETLSALLFPFSWQHVYIPILPARLLDILQAPVPFLIGIDDEVLGMAEAQMGIPDEVVQVDLDKNEVLCSEAQAKAVVLPQKQYYKLYKALAPYCRAPTAEQQQGDKAASAFAMAPPPDVEGGEHAPTLAEMSDEAVAEAIKAVKAAFLRFFVSLMAKYQEVMVVPPGDIKQPSAVDFFDVRKWMARFPAPSHEWLQGFVDGQAFTQWLEQRLAPQQTPELEVVFFNESIDAKLNRGAKTKLFSKASTPLLSSGDMPSGGYVGTLVPAQVRTVYNASMIAARPVRQQQQVALLLVLGSGLHEFEPGVVADFEASLKQEFASNLLWSRVDIGAALRTHACAWRSAAAKYHSQMGGQGLENVEVRQALLDAVLYAHPEYRAALHQALRDSLAALTVSEAGSDGGELPLCVIAHGFGSVLAIDFFAQLQTERCRAAPAPPPAATEPASGGGGGGGGGEGAGGAAAGSTPLERGETLAYFCTLGSPQPLLVPQPGASGLAPGEKPTGPVVPTAYMAERWPHLRGGWSNFYHRGDLAGHPLQPSLSGVTEDVECRQRQAKGEVHSMQNAYLHDLVDCVRPIAQSISWVWQDTNQKPSAQKWQE